MEYVLTKYRNWGGKDQLGIIRGSWNDILEEFKTPVVTEDKEGVHMFLGAEMQVGKERRGANVVKYTFLVLDYDNTVHWNYMLDQNRDLDCTVYTSFSNAKGKPCFRVLIPFDEPVSADDYKRYKPVFQMMFPEADPSGFSLSQSFYLPCYHPERKEDFYQHRRKGLPLSVTDLDFESLSLDIENLKVRMKKRRPLFEQEKEVSFEDQLEALQAALRSTDPDLPYDVWKKLGMGLKGFMGDDGFGIWTEFNQGSKDERCTYRCDVDNLWSRWCSYSDESPYSNVGFFINRAKEHPRGGDTQ